MALVLLVFCLQNNVFAQNVSEINQSWENLKNEFLNKEVTVLKLITKVDKSKVIEKEELNQTEIYAKKLKTLLIEKEISKEEINKVKQTNDLLNTHLVRVLVELESDFKLKKITEIQILTEELSNIENAIFSNVNKHNQICEKLNKKEFMFPVQTLE